MPKLFAEYLQHIGSITLTIELDSLVNDETTITLDDQTLRLSHHGIITSIQVPAEFLVQGSINSYLPTPPLTCSTVRIPLSKREEVSFFLESTSLPWSATDLRPKCVFQCSAQECTTRFVDGTVDDFRDLPSESWAEMMDLWHCHKPNEDDHNHNKRDNDSTKPDEQKGYSANSKLVAKPGVGFVNALSFLLSPGDCKNLDLQHQSSREKVDTLHCSNCNTQVGESDALAQGYRLFKPFISILPPSTSALDNIEQLPRLTTTIGSLPLMVWFSTHLSTLASSTGCRRFKCSYRRLSLWVFSTDVVFSSSSSSPSSLLTDSLKEVSGSTTLVPPNSYSITAKDGMPKNGIKVLFQPSIAETNNESTTDGEKKGQQGDSMSGSQVEELGLAKILEDLFIDEMIKTSEALPMTMRKFADWNVAYIERYVQH